MAPLDIAKALKTLGLPAEHKAALAKALACDDARCIKALDELAKQSKLKQSGKDMLATLRKAKIARCPYGIVGAQLGRDSATAGLRGLHVPILVPLWKKP